MNSKKMKIVLVTAVLVLSFAGCGKDTDAIPVDGSNVSVESAVNTDINETNEADLSDMSAEITATPTPEATSTPTPEPEVATLDESMAGTYYVIAEEGIPYYAENDTTSDVLGTLAYDLEVTALGMSTETNLFQIELDDGTTVWVESGNLDVVRGDYQVDEDTAISDESTTSSEDSQQGVQPPTQEEAQATLPSSFAGEPWYEALTPAEKAQVDNALQNSLDGTAGALGSSWWDENRQDAVSDDDIVIEESTLGDGSGLTPGGELE